MTENPTIPPRNKPMIIAGFSFYVLFALFAILKSRFPEEGGGWANSRIFDDVFVLGFSICWSVLCVGYTYYAWTLNADDFAEWMKKQVFVPKKQAQKPISDFARSYNQWIFRYIMPVGALSGVGMVMFMVFAIMKYLLK